MGDGEVIYPRTTMITTFLRELATSEYREWLLAQRKKRLAPAASPTPHALKNLLIQNWQQQQRDMLAECDDQQEDLREVLSTAQNIATIRKENVFAGELTAEEQDIVRQRVELQRKQYEEYMRRQNARRTRKICNVLKHITEKEALYALKECQDDEVQELLSQDT